MLEPVWMYGLQLWGCIKKSNARIIQNFQKVLRGIINAPCYIRNIYKDNTHKNEYCRRNDYTNGSKT